MRKHIREIFTQKIVIIKIQDSTGQVAAYHASSTLQTPKKETHDEVQKTILGSESVSRARIKRRISLFSEAVYVSR